MDQALRVDTSPFSQLDQRFLLILFASIAVHIVAATWVVRQPHVSPTELDEPTERWTRAPLLPIPKLPPPVHVAKPAAPVAPTHGAPARGGPTDGLLGLVGALNKELGHDDVQGLLDGARTGNVDPSKLGTRREGVRRTESIDVTTDGTRDLGLGARTDAVPGRTDSEPIDGLPEVPDPEGLQRFIRSHSRGLAYCYERGLRHSRSLRGKLTIRFMLTAQGRTDQVLVADDALGSAEVSDCVVAAVRRWVFPFRPDSDAPVQFPVLFTPAQ